MQVRLSTRLECGADEAWRQVLRPALLDHVAWPLLVFRPLEPLPSEWETGEHVVHVRALGVIPLGRQVIAIRREDPGPTGVGRLLDDGRGTSGALRSVTMWRHLIVIEPDAADLRRCAYRDEVDVHAGWVTPVVWLFAGGFYRWRQRRWRRLVRARFAGLTES